MRIDRHASPDVGGRVRQPPDPTKPYPNHAFSREGGEVGSSRAANRPTIVELAKRSIEVPARLRKQRIAETRSLPALP
jgi:hypothetical protein